MPFDASATDDETRSNETDLLRLLQRWALFTLDFGGSVFGGTAFGGADNDWLRESQRRALFTLDFGTMAFGGIYFGGTVFGGMAFGGADIDWLRELQRRAGISFGGMAFGGVEIVLLRELQRWAGFTLVFGGIAFFVVPAFIAFCSCRCLGGGIVIAEAFFDSISRILVERRGSNGFERRSKRTEHRRTVA